MNYDIIVIGSGPGGYVTAIRASQLGFKTAIIEKENLGGICLNWGCIPTKALLKSAQVFKYINHAEDFGLNKVEASFDFPNVVQRSRGVAEKMSKGVEFLMKKNKIDVIFGTAKVKPGKKVAVEKDGAVTEYTAEHIVLATGARSRELPNLPQDGKKVIGYRQALTLPKQPKSMIVVIIKLKYITKIVCYFSFESTKVIIKSYASLCASNINCSKSFENMKLFSRFSNTADSNK